MARKRTVTERNEDGDGSDDAGSYVPAANKRSRPSTSTQPNTASASPDLDDDDDDDMNGDEDFAEEGGDEGMREMRGDVRRLQNLNQSNARRQEQVMAAAGEGDGGHIEGIVKKLYLENFMCHERLTFDFGPYMNFIIGHNGSGKSAVLTGLSIVLGGNTKNTGRGSGIGALVKTGASRALLRVHLRNTGTEAYHPALYGPEIIIERTFGKEGGSAWKIKSSANKTITTKKKDLEPLLEHFSLQMNNPMTILTQDMSRSFLAGSTPKQKYDRFLEGTLLQQLLDDYGKLETASNHIESNNKRQEEGLVPLEKNMEKWQKIQEQMSGIQEIQAEIDRMNGDMCWASVKEKRVEMAKQQKVLDKATREEEIAKVKGESFEEDIRLAQEAMKEAAKEELEFRNANDSVDAEVDRATNELKEIQAKKSRQKETIDSLMRAIDQKNKTRQEVEKKRADEIARTGHADYAKRRAELTAKKEDLEAKMAKSQADRPKKQERRTELKTEFDKIQASIRDTKAGKAAVEANIEKYRGILRQKHNQQRSGQVDQWGRYGTNLQAVVQEINRLPWKGGKPLGPLGMFVKIKQGQDKYLKVLEASLGQYLTAWAVRDNADRAQLLKIFKNCIDRHRTKFEVGRGDPKAMPTILTHSGELFDYSAGDMSRHNPTVLSVLEISDPHVIRLLINTSNIEQNFVSVSRMEADEIAKRHGASGRGTVYTADKFRVNTTRNGGLQSTPVNDWNGQSLLVTDLMAEIKMIEDTITGLEPEIQDFVTELHERETQREECSVRLGQTDNQIKALDRWIPDFREKIRAIDAELAVEESINIAMMNEEIERIQTQVDAEEAQCVGLQEDMENTVAALGRKRAERDEIKKRRDDYAQDLNTLRENIREAKMHLEQRQKRKADHSRAGTRLREATAQAQQVLSVAEQEMAGLLETAVGICPEERNPARSSVEIHEAINNAKKRKEKQQSRMQYDFDYVVQQLNLATEKFNRVKNALEDTQHVLKELETSLLNRRKQWHTMRGDFSVQSTVNFKTYLKERGFRGLLEIEHETQTIDLRVQTDVGADGQEDIKKMKKADALSGGETSFTGICLLLAIWSNVQCPLRCLDEFDVFMDAANRKLAMTTLVDVATKPRKDTGVRHQYILITPQEMSGATLDPQYTKVLRMPDPERGQTRLARNLD